MFKKGEILAGQPVYLYIFCETHVHYFILAHPFLFIVIFFPCTQSDVLLPSHFCILKGTCTVMLVMIVATLLP